MTSLKTYILRLPRSRARKQNVDRLMAVSGGDALSLRQYSFLHISFCCIRCILSLCVIYFVKKSRLLALAFEPWTLALS